MLYKISHRSLVPIKKKNPLEKAVQNLVEKNLQEVFNLDFVESEFSIENVRFDTLAFDRETNSPVIIEFKKGFEKSLFDQGLEYLNILFSRKADFAITLHRKLKTPIDIEKINWSSARVIFVGGHFSERQKRAIAFQGLPVELWRFEWHENNFFQIEKEDIQKEAKLSEFTKSITNKNSAVKTIQKEVKEYDREYHQQNANKKIWELFEKIENELLSWDDFKINYRKLYIAFFLKNSFCVVKILKSKLQVEFGKKQNASIFKKIPIVKDISSKEFNHAFMFELENDRTFDELFFVLRQNYKLFKSN